MEHTLGTLQFDKIDADAIIKEGFTEIEFSKLSCLVNDDIPYHKFYENIKENENKVLL